MIEAAMELFEMIDALYIEFEELKSTTAKSWAELMASVEPMVQKNDSPKYKKGDRVKYLIDPENLYTVSRVIQGRYVYKYILVPDWNPMIQGIANEDELEKA